MATTAVRGATPEERVAARRARSRERRTDHYVALIRAARWGRKDPTETLQHACAYLRAVAHAELTDDEVFALAEQVSKMADERNKP
jgi:5-methylcytosine-specific restriction endonuclease McrA